MNMTVRRTLGSELIRDGGSLCATFETDAGRFGVFLKIEIADRDPSTKERLGYAAPVLIDLDPAKRPQDTEGRKYSELSGPTTTMSWQEARTLLAQMAVVGPALGDREAGLLDEMRYVADSAGSLPPSRDRLMRVRTLLR